MANTTRCHSTHVKYFTIVDVNQVKDHNVYEMKQK